MDSAFSRPKRQQAVQCKFIAVRRRGMAWVAPVAGDDQIFIALSLWKNDMLCLCEAIILRARTKRPLLGCNVRDCFFAFVPSKLVKSATDKQV